MNEPKRIVLCVRVALALLFRSTFVVSESRSLICMEYKQPSSSVKIFRVSKLNLYGLKSITQLRLPTWTSLLPAALRGRAAPEHCTVIYYARPFGALTGLAQVRQRKGCSFPPSSVQELQYSVFAASVDQSQVADI